MKKIKYFFSRLTKINEEESLSKFSLIMVIMLDIFLFFAVIEGISQNIDQLTNVYEYAPRICRDIVIDKDLPEKIGDRIEFILLNQKRKVNSYYSSTSLVEYQTLKDSQKAHPICKEYALMVNNLKKDEKIIELFEQRKSLNTKYNTIKHSIKTLPFDADKNVVGDIAKSNNEKYKELNDIFVEIEAIDKQISSNNDISRLYELTNSSQKKILENDLDRFRFWFPIKEFLVKFLFLLPIFGLLSIWFLKNLKKDKGIQLLISSHALTVVSIPILFEVLHVIYSILPKTLFKNIIGVLETLHLIAIWHYLIIALAIGFVMLIVYFVQKKCFSLEVVARKRLSKNECIFCGKKIPHDSRHCISCGKSQFIKCPNCQKDTYTHSRFCKECGAELK